MNVNQRHMKNGEVVDQGEALERISTGIWGWTTSLMADYRRAICTWSRVTREPGRPQWLFNFFSPASSRARA
jgi:hypothetical protein